jgi:hypothetical protein
MTPSRRAPRAVEQSTYLVFISTLKNTVVGGRHHDERAFTVEQKWHTQDSHGQILALAFRSKSLKALTVLPLGSERA